MTIDVLLFLALILAVVAFAYYIWDNKNKTRISHYNQLDSAYQVLLTLAFENTYLRKPGTFDSPEQIEKYDIYAFMVWNFLEAIYDNCMKDKSLIETWGPIIEVEGALHIEWFKNISNKVKFKQAFYHYVEEFVEAIVMYKEENNLSLS